MNKLNPSRGGLVAAVVTVVLASAVARAAPPGAVRATSGPSADDQLGRATAALQRDDYAAAAKLAGAVARGRFRGAAGRQDRAEAWRIYGIALFLEGHRKRAEAAFVSYLKLDYNGHLDPAVVPPEVIVFFEDLRTRHAAELEKYRPRPREKHYLLLNLLPPAGQFQNGDRGKGWAIAATGAVLIAANITSFVLLDRWCGSDGVCQSGGADRTAAASDLRTLNVASAIGLVAVYVYGVADGWIHYRRHAAAPTPQVSPTASIDRHGRLVLGAAVRF